MYKKQGFTLIELLVVVLIIGILAAVALPQYQLAVLKSRYATLQPLVKAMANAQEVYYLANGEYASSFSQLDINMPAGGQIQLNNNGESMVYDQFSCSVWQAGRVDCQGYNDVDYGHYEILLEHSTGGRTGRFCAVGTRGRNAEILRKLCTSLGGVKEFTSRMVDYYRLP